MGFVRNENAYYMKGDYTKEIDIKKDLRKQLNIIDWKEYNDAFHVGAGSFISIGEDCYVAEQDEQVFEGGSSVHTQIGSGTYDNLSGDFDGTYYAVVDRANPPNVWTTTDPTGTWTSNTLSWAAEQANQIRYISDTGYWYLVGTDGFCARTTDPSGTWTDISLSTGAYDLYSINYGNSMYIIGGALLSGTGSYYYTSTDGTTFTERIFPNDGSTAIGNMFDIKYHNGTWVAGLDYGGIGYSTTGTSWSLNRIGSTSSDVTGVTYDETNNLWVVAATYTDGILYASDPSGSWTSATLPDFPDYLRDVKYYDGALYCVGQSGYVAFATHPNSWTKANIGTTQYHYSLYYGAGGLLISVEDGYIIFVPQGLSAGKYIFFNGTDWTFSTTPPEYDGVRGGYFSTSDSSYRCIGYWTGAIVDPVITKRGAMY